MRRLKFGSRGQDVRLVQWALIAHDYDLPRWGAGGHLGGETWRTLADFADDHGLTWSDKAIEDETGFVPKAVVVRLLARDDDEVPTGGEGGGGASGELGVIDMRPDRAGELPPKTRRRDGAVVVRPASKIDGIVVHQTACEFGVSARQVRAAGGDKRLALRRRFLNVACHMAALRNGDVLLTNDLRTFVHHGNRLNPRTLGLEIEGRYPGLKDRPKKTTWGGTPSKVTPTVVEAAQRAVTALVELGAKEGIAIKYIFAHRQSSATRRSDPGEELWDKVVRQHAVEKLGLKTLPKKFVGTGRPIPKAWDPRGAGRY